MEYGRRLNDLGADTGSHGLTWLLTNLCSDLQIKIGPFFHKLWDDTAEELLINYFEIGKMGGHNLLGIIFL
jgi:hypothetical protein